MGKVQLFAVTPSGPRPIPLPRPLSGLHDLPDELPFGVYTAFRTFKHNQFLCLNDHLNRLAESLSLLGLAYRPDWSEIRRALHESCTAFPGANARVRIDILASPLLMPGVASRELLTLAPFEPTPSVYYEEGVRLALAPRLQRLQPLAKKADFVLARRNYPTGGPEIYEYLLLDAEGHLLEGSSSNFFAVRNGVVWTAGESVLEGITRSILLKLLIEQDVPLNLAPVHLEEVDLLDEAFLSSSSRGVLPVVVIDGRQVGNGRPGPLTRRLMRRYNQYVEAAIRPAVDR